MVTAPGKSIYFLLFVFCCTSGSTLWLGPHDRIMRLWIHGGCTMNPQPHDPIMRLWIHGTQGIGPGTRHWPRTASPHDPIMRGDGPASPQCCTILYCTGSWIKDQGSWTLDLGPCSGMNDHPGRDTDVISRPSESTIKDLSFYTGFTTIQSSNQGSSTLDIVLA